MKVVPVYQEEFLFDDTNSIIQVFKELQVQIPALLIPIPTLFTPIPTLFAATDFFLHQFHRKSCNLNLVPSIILQIAIITLVTDLVAL